MADVKRVLNVRVSAASRRNLEDAAKKFHLGIANVVDRVLARPEQIALAVMAAFEAASGTAPGSWRGKPRERLPVVRGPQLELGRKAGKGAGRGARK